MNLTSPSDVKAWCLAHDFHPNRTLGQNFLIDRNALMAIVDAAELAAPTRVLEIGPGLGALTEELLRRGHEVFAIEKDPVLAGRLAGALGSPSALTVRAGDALVAIREGACDGYPALVSNLPYQAGTRILLELLRRVDHGAAVPQTCVILVQTEVAERLAAGPGSKVRGLAGVWAQLDYDVKIVRTVKNVCFWPRPEVGSSVVRLTRHNRNAALTPEFRNLFRSTVKMAFEHRRKQLGSIFRGRLTSSARAEELSNEDWLALTKGFQDAHA